MYACSLAREALQVNPQQSVPSSLALSRARTARTDLRDDPCLLVDLDVWDGAVVA